MYNIIGKQSEDFLFYPIAGEHRTAAYVLMAYNWMTEHFDSYLHSTSTESSPGSSIPPSPLEHDVQVPSDLEVMTSLLKEELAQLEDYYLFESTPMKAEKWPKCDKGYQAMATSSYYQLPGSSYSVSQSESNPRLVTLAAAERDLKGICGSSVVRTSRPAPYSYVRTHSTSQRIASNGCKDVEVVEKETWTFKGTHSGYAEMGLDPCAVDRIFAKNHNGAKKVRECAILLKEEEKKCFTEDVFYRAEMVKSFDSGAPINVHHKREGQFHGMKMLGHGHDSVPMPVLHCSENGSNSSFKHPGVAECYFSHISSNLDPYLGFMNEVDQSVRTGPVESQNMGYSNHECLVDQSFEYMSGDSVGSSLEFPVQKPVQRLRENVGVFKQEVKVSCFERSHGERKQKKRDQNKTAAYRQEEQNNADLHHLCYRNNTRYRQRKRAEQDCLEEELHGLEGRNRELRDKAESVEREIQYVKDLLIEVYKARSQRLKEDFNT